ncbi:unnamed protein product, partial [Iphiclides podalirius]
MQTDADCDRRCAQGEYQPQQCVGASKNGVPREMVASRPICGRVPLGALVSRRRVTCVPTYSTSALGRQLQTENSTTPYRTAETKFDEAAARERPRRANVRRKASPTTLIIKHYAMTENGGEFNLLPLYTWRPNIFLPDTSAGLPGVVGRVPIRDQWHVTAERCVAGPDMTSPLHTDSRQQPRHTVNRGYVCGQRFTAQSASPPVYYRSMEQ